MNKARSLAGATLAFAIVSCLGFVIPLYWFPGLGGLLGIIGTSIIVCCAGSSHGGHIACAALCMLAAILHAVGVGIYIWFYAEAVSAAWESAGSEYDADVQLAVAAWVWILVWPTVIFNLISMILEIIQVVFCFKASSAINAGALPTRAVKGAPVQA